MKNKITSAIYLLLPIFFGILMLSCNKLKVGEDVAWQGLDASATVPVVSDVQIHTSMGVGSFSYNLDSMIKSQTANAFNLSSVTKVTVSKCALTLVNPEQTNNFANFETCTLFFNTDKDPVTVQTATISNNPDLYAETLNIPVDNTIDLKSYLFSITNTSPSTMFSYIIGGQLRRPTTKTLTINVHVEYTIHVGS